MDIEDSGDFVEEPAIGQRGCLIRGMDDRVYFRVYDSHRNNLESNNFVDYEITHYDCEVVIIDPSAALIQHPAGDFLDYASEHIGDKNA